jgi:hypothetical protein
MVLHNPVREEPDTRPLKVYAFDPTRGRALGNFMTVATRYEPLLPGPVGKQLAVVDYDATNKCYYRPVDLEDPAVLVRGGLEPSEADPQFHQQMAYAVASETVRRFERALGRPIRWSFARWGAARGPQRDQLRIHPHALQEANAYYSRDLRALVFGYFPASTTDPGGNLPGQTVFTCLSHDIIAHETTHALVDSQRDFFMEPTSPDAPAFHEAFADIVALFQHFSFMEAVLEMTKRTGGLIYRPNVEPLVGARQGQALIQPELSTTNPLVELARQFGDAMGMRAALRSALGTPPNSDALAKLVEPHARGSILVAAVFDAYFTIYVERTHDLFRIARARGFELERNELPPDLAVRLAKEAVKTAQHFLNICIRALDYCPPVDIRFGDFIRAVITADRDLVPEDEHGYRNALIEAFKSRGIFPENASSGSEDAVRWAPPAVFQQKVLPRCEGLTFDVFDPDESSRRKRQKHNGIALHYFAQRNAQWLGLSTNPGVKVQARTFHEVHRVGPNGELAFDMVAELTQHRDVPVDPANPAAGTFTFRGGTTLIIGQDGRVRYAIQKSVGQPKGDSRNERLTRQRAYRAELEANLSVAPFADDRSIARSMRDPAMNFRRIHRGY